LKEKGCHWRSASRLFWVLTVILGIAVMVACRRGMPVIDTGPRPAQADGTVSGTVRGPEGTSRVEGRTVEVENVDTGERRRTATNNAGGFTFKLPPGKYRLTLTLLPGEALVKQPGVINLNRSDVDAFADFVIGASRISRPRWPRPLRSDDGLGAPSA
jgi:hypothetical protein